MGRARRREGRVHVRLGRHCVGLNRVRRCGQHFARLDLLFLLRGDRGGTAGGPRGDRGGTVRFCLLASLSLSLGESVSLSRSFSSALLSGQLMQSR